MKYFIHFFIFLCCSASCYGALPPQAQRLREMQRILAEPDLLAKVSGEMIEALIYQPDQQYRIVTDKSIMQVRIKYLPLSQPGPARFELEFSKLISRPTP